MQSQGNIRVVEMLRYLFQHTDENHTATVTDITAYLKERGIQAVRQTVYADLNALITAGFDIVIVKSTQNQYFMGNRLFEYPELKMLADAVASSKIISAKKRLLHQCYPRRLKHESIGRRDGRVFRKKPKRR